jgi:hypothetical protein
VSTAAASTAASLAAAQKAQALVLAHSAEVERELTDRYGFDSPLYASRLHCPHFLPPLSPQHGHHRFEALQHRAGQSAARRGAPLCCRKFSSLHIISLTTLSAVVVLFRTTPALPSSLASLTSATRRLSRFSTRSVQPANPPRSPVCCPCADGCHAQTSLLGDSHGGSVDQQGHLMSLSPVRRFR